MKTRYLNMSSIVWKTNFLTGLILCFVAFRSPAQKAQSFIYDCATIGQNFVIDVNITGADASTFYHWQFKTPTDGWTCFINGSNIINGTNFTVNGATGTGANNAPALTIFSIDPALENVMVRVTMSRGTDPCGLPSPQVWGGDDQSPEETKNLRLHVFVNSLSCPPNAFQCPSNKLINSNKYYGGFENTSFEGTTETYTRSNISVGNGESDLTFGSGNGHYQDINNPYSMNQTFGRNIAPHTGDYQMVVEGSTQLSDRIWHKTINVVAGRQYAFSMWLARVDSTDPLIELRANNAILISGDFSQQPIGSWSLIQGTFVANAAIPVDFSIQDSRLGGDNNFTIDDICLRECNSCSILQLHQLNLTATLQQPEIRIRWVAENEMGTNNFIIERSFDGVNFETLASKIPSGPVNTPTSYFHTDNVTNIGVNSMVYYRIKALDTDGRYAYSNVVVIRLSKSATLQAWPVPFTDNINISYNSSTNSKIEISITNTLGKITRQKVISVSRGLNQLSIDDLTELSSGIYFVRIKDLNSGVVNIRKISK